MEATLLFTILASNISRLLLVVFLASIPGKRWSLVVNTMPLLKTIFSAHAQTNQLLTQDQLFSRISGNYVKMICEPVVEIKWKDSFFKVSCKNVCVCAWFMAELHTDVS